MKGTTKVNSRAYQLKKPLYFEEVIIQHDLMDHWVTVRPQLASICNADLRYYTGNRRKEALSEKLPMALFHEGIGEVTDSNHTGLREGQLVVIAPNISADALHPENYRITDDSSRVISENHDENSLFLGSDIDGIGQQHLPLPSSNIIQIPEDIPNKIALLSELNSIPLNALKSVQSSIHDGKVAVFGDGPVGYVTAAMLHFVYEIPKERLIVFGAIKEKLDQFDFATTYLVQEYDFKQKVDVVTIIECTGGTFSESAINQAIDLIEPEGRIVLLGVTEERVPINTRDILAKGITVSGNSRSTIQEFKDLMGYFKNASYQKALHKLLPDQYDEVANAEDLKNVFDDVVESKAWKKRVIRFKW